jgi:CRP-like cAMP-binding protein
MSVDDQLAEKYSQEFPAGAVLFRAGDDGHEMYVIQSGRVRISVFSGEMEKVLDELGPGEFFGEMAVLNERPRTATATVLENSQLLVIEQEKLEILLRANSEVAIRLIRRLAKRLERTDHSVTILLHRDPRARLILGLSEFARDRGETTAEGILVGVSIDELASFVGLEPTVASEAMRRLHRLDLVSTLGIDSMLVRNVIRMQEYLSYLELKERYGD